MMHILVNSGAFSSFNLGQPIDLDVYIEFLKPNAGRILSLCQSRRNPWKLWYP